MKRLGTNTSERLRGGTVQKKNGGRGAEGQETTGGRGPRAPGRNLGFRVQRVRKGRKWPTRTNLPSAAFPDFQGDTGVKFLLNNLGREKVTFARNGFAERARNCQRVSMRSPMGTPHNRDVGNVLMEEGGKVWATVREFGLVSGLRAVGAGLLVLRRADRNVKSCVKVAQAACQCQG